VYYFNDYVDLLLPPSQLSVKQPIHTVDFRTLIRLNQLGGRGCTTLLYTPSAPLSQFVLKGIDFATFFNSYESGHIREEVKIFYRSMELVSNMPRHPNIMAPVQTLVTANLAMIGHLCVVVSIHSSQMEALLVISRRATNPANEYHYRIRLNAAAITHTHFVAHTYHIDIKPDNFLLDTDSNLVLIDWEQCDASIATAALEIDGT
jgi:serine/threonine protein kinase